MSNVPLPPTVVAAAAQETVGETMKTQGLSYISGGISILAGALTFNEWLMLIGAIIGLLTYLFNRSYTKKKTAREEEESKCYKELLAAQKRLADLQAEEKRLDIEERALEKEGFKARKHKRLSDGNQSKSNI